MKPTVTKTDGRRVKPSVYLRAISQPTSHRLPMNKITQAMRGAPGNRGVTFPYGAPVEFHGAAILPTRPPLQDDPAGRNRAVDGGPMSSNIEPLAREMAIRICRRSGMPEAEIPHWVCLLYT